MTVMGGKERRRKQNKSSSPPLCSRTWDSKDGTLFAEDILVPTLKDLLNQNLAVINRLLALQLSQLLDILFGRLVSLQGSDPLVEKAHARGDGLVPVGMELRQTGPHGPAIDLVVMPRRISPVECVDNVVICS